ncbi:MAG: VOC family protein [Hyphomicrobiaceae bacterium]|nr:VOC family protein [Hyphomicrobiaceae bacterium]
MGRVVHFEIHADDPQRAIAFYETVFGWTFQEFVPGYYWLATTGPDDKPGINGGLVPRKAGQTGSMVAAYICTIEVDDIDMTIERFRKEGGVEAVARHAIPSLGWQFYGKDPEGNIVGVHQPDPSAI